MHKIRSAICCSAISSEQNNTCLGSEKHVAFTARFRAKLVFPIEGLAAMMTRSESWNPSRRRSSASYCVGMPVTCAPRSLSDWIRVTASRRTSSRRRTRPRTRSSPTEKTLCSARSRYSSGSYSDE